jgi:SGNH hydrolase-like domain, acetyltransferase AlgX
MNGQKVTRTLRDGLIVVGITSALFVLSELGLRLIFSKKADAEPTSNPQVAYELNQDYEISLKPNLRQVSMRELSNGGTKIIWETNSLGFRGADLKQNYDFRVMVYGDSNIQAKFSSLENTFCYRLEKYLTQQLHETKVDVVNAGLSGAGPDENLLKLSKAADVYNPDMIILHVFADNDFGDLVRNRLFDLDAAGNLVRTTFPPTKDELFIKADLETANQIDLDRMLSSLFLLRAGRRVVRLFEQGRWNDTEPTTEEFIRSEEARLESEFSVFRADQARKFSHFDDRYDMDVAIDPQAASSKTKIKLMRAVLKEVKSVTDAKQIRLLVLIEPSQTDLTTNGKISYKDLEAYPDYKPNNLTKSIDEICDTLDIEKVDLFEVFARNNPEELYFRYPDDHWNDAGQDLAAKVTSAYIAQNMLKNGGLVAQIDSNENGSPKHSSQLRTPKKWVPDRCCAGK